MTKKPKKSRLKHWVQTLSPAERAQLKERFMRDFGVTNKSYYRIIGLANLTLDRALWFADQLDLTAEDLTRYPHELGRTMYDDQEE